MGLSMSCFRAAPVSVGSPSITWAVVVRHLPPPSRRGPPTPPVASPSSKRSAIGRSSIVAARPTPPDHRAGNDGGWSRRVKRGAPMRDELPRQWLEQTVRRTAGQASVVGLAARLVGPLAVPVVGSRLSGPWSSPACYFHAVMSRRVDLAEAMRGRTGGSWCVGGSDGIRSHARTTATGFVLVGLSPVRRTVGISGRAPYARQRPTRLTPEEIATIRANADRPLRELAAEYGVSHETVRRAMRHLPPITGPAGDTAA